MKHPPYPFRNSTYALGENIGFKVDNKKYTIIAVTPEPPSFSDIQKEMRSRYRLSITITPFIRSNLNEWEAKVLSFLTARI